MRRRHLRLASRQTAGGLPRHSWPLLILLALSSLACITTRLSFRIARQGDANHALTTEIQQELSEEYLLAARELNEKYRREAGAAGEEGRDIFPVQIEAANLEPLSALGYEIVSRDDTGFVAQLTQVFATTIQGEVSFGELGTNEYAVDVVAGDHGEPRYVVDLTLPAYPFTDLPAEEESGAGANPPPASLDPVDSVMSGIGSVLEDMASAIPETVMEDVESLLEQTGLPQFIYTVELPGPIIAYQVDGEARGGVDGNRFTLVLDQVTLNSYGTGPYQVHLEATVVTCPDYCSGKPHLAWDGVSTLPNCACVCERGWEVFQDQDGPRCVTCETVCSLRGEHLEVDPANLQPNTCACRCAPGYEMIQGECLESANPPPDPQTIRTQLLGLVISMHQAGQPVVPEALPNWSALSPEEQTTIRNLANALNATVSQSQSRPPGAADAGIDPDALTPYQQALYQQGQTEELRLDQLREAMIDQIAAELYTRQTIQHIITRELYLERGGPAGQWLYDHGAALSQAWDHVKSALDWYDDPQKMAAAYVDGYIEGRENDLLATMAGVNEGASVKTPQQIAVDAIKQIPDLALVDAPRLYRIYHQDYLRLVPYGTEATEDEKHDARILALSELRTRLQEAVGRQGGQFVDPSAVGSWDWLEDDGPYARAFAILDERADIQRNPLEGAMSEWANE